MKVQQVSYYLSFFSASSASLLDFTYDFCDSSSILSSLNPLCDRPSAPSLDLDFSHDHDAAQHVLPSSHTHDHEARGWSHIPNCFHQPNTTDQYCVYTDNTFASQRGISIYTNSLYASSLHELEAFTSPAILAGANEQNDARYAQRAIPGKGLGLVALVPIHRGEQLFRSTPVLLLQEQEGEGGNETERSPFLKRAVANLPASSRRMFEELKGHFGSDPVQDRIDTNCFAVELDVAGLAVGATAVFPEMSRMNHDCRPNAHYYFDPHTLIQSVHALRTILPGEEITISYIDPAQPSHERKEALHNAWGFPCGCNACNAPLPIRQASDARVSEIQRLQSLLSDYTAESKVKDSKTGVQMAELLVELYTLEGMLGPVSEGYAYAAIEYNSAMRKWEALRYAHKALEAGLLYGGPKDGDVLGMAELIAGPEGHWSWGVRARRRWESKQKVMA